MAYGTYEPLHKMCRPDERTVEARAHELAVSRFNGPIRAILHHFEKLYSTEMGCVGAGMQRCFPDARLADLVKMALAFVESLFILDCASSITTRTLTMTVGAMLACDVSERGLFKQGKRAAFCCAHAKNGGACECDAFPTPRAAVTPAEHKMRMQTLILDAGRTECLLQTMTRMSDDGSEMVKVFGPGYAVDTNYEASCHAMKKRMLALSCMSTPAGKEQFRMLAIQLPSLDCLSKDSKVKTMLEQLFKFVLVQLDPTDKKLGVYIVNLYTAFHTLKLFPSSESYFMNANAVLLMLQCIGVISSREDFKEMLGLSFAWERSYFPDDAMAARVLQSQMKLVAYDIISDNRAATHALFANVITEHAALFKTDTVYAAQPERTILSACTEFFTSRALTADTKLEGIRANLTALGTRPEPALIVFHDE